MRALRVICAWCDECLSGPASAPATHTICRACVVKYFPAQALAIGALQDGAVVAREIHNLKVAGSIPAPATTLRWGQWLRRSFVAHDTATVSPCACCARRVVGTPAGQQRFCEACVAFIDPSFTPVNRIGNTETKRIGRLPAVDECAESPKGLGREGYKPLMRNLAPIYAASPIAMIAGNTFAPTTHGAWSPTPAVGGSPAGVFVFMRKLLQHLFGPGRNRRGKRLHRWLAINRSVVQI